MGSISGETIDWDGQDSGAREEKIYVSVRLRPLNERELANNDVSDWECINSTTIIFKNSFQERSMSPTAYTFDRVFGKDNPTSQVYEDAAKKIVLSVLSGVNSTIFAYGQTSSGKTYTMSGITEYAIEDIYNYIDKHRERDFILKFSAMEIYNESVKDLLSTDGTPLRLLDDPERGTVVDKLTEVTLRDSNHLRELLSVCESQRQTGETTLNELSSRSHQILRLTVESEAREYFGAENMSTLTASVNFVDLAGSERASQTLSAGTRLKEGCHINRSLLTLGTIIRKLSKGRNGHIPYRNSKLTRILQNSLGGNAKTAIICTMSPAHSHVEQSRNTLLFASCAKQVSTNAQVNVVMSEKALVKHLQKELARLENELRSLRGLSLIAAPGRSASALKEKELLIEKMDKEIRDLTLQRDLAQSRADNMLHTGGERQEPKNWIYMNSVDKGSWASEYSASEASEIFDPLRSDTASCVSHYSDRYERASSIRNEETLLENNEEQFLADDTSPTLYIDKYFGPDPCQGWEKIGQEIDKNSEDNCKEVQCIEIQINESNTVSDTPSSPKENQASGQSPCSSDEDLSDSNVNVTRSKSCAAILTTITESPRSDVANENEGASQDEADKQGIFFNIALVADSEILCTKDAETSVKSAINRTEKNIKILGDDCTANQQESRSTEVNEVIKPNVVMRIKDDLESEPDDVTTYNDQEKIANDGFNKAQDMQQSGLENISSNVLNQDTKQSAFEKIPNYGIDNAQDIKEIALDKIVDCGFNEVRNIKQSALEKIADERFDEAGDIKRPKKIADDGFDKAQDTKPLEKIVEDNLVKYLETKQFASDWSTEFEKQKREIIELWNLCNIPLVHRTYFFLLFKGDPSDAIYMEVELRRLTFLKNSLHGVTFVKDEEFTHASSLKALNREREMLSKRMLKKFSTKDRESLYEKWGIDLKSKQRRLQLCRRLFTDSTNMEHIRESASIVAKLVGLKEPGQAPVGLSFSQKPVQFRSFSWKHSLPSMV